MKKLILVFVLLLIGTMTTFALNPFKGEWRVEIENPAHLIFQDVEVAENLIFSSTSVTISNDDFTLKCRYKYDDNTITLYGWNQDESLPLSIIVFKYQTYEIGKDGNVIVLNLDYDFQKASKMFSATNSYLANCFAWIMSAEKITLTER
jgi:hypothetical protein